MTRKRIGRFIGTVIFAAIASALVFGAVALAPVTAQAATHNRADKKLSSKEAAAFIKKMTVEMDIVLYPIISLPHAKAWREDMMKRFGARGSMKRKTRKQIAEFFKTDARAAFTDPEISNQVVDAVDRLLAAEESPK